MNTWVYGICVIPCLWVCGKVPFKLITIWDNRKGGREGVCVCVYVCVCICVCLSLSQRHTLRSAWGSKLCWIFGWLDLAYFKITLICNSFFYLLPYVLSWIWKNNSFLKAISLCLEIALNKKISFHCMGKCHVLKLFLWITCQPLGLWVGLEFLLENIETIVKHLIIYNILQSNETFFSHSTSSVNRYVIWKITILF